MLTCVNLYFIEIGENSEFDGATPRGIRLNPGRVIEWTFSEDNFAVLVLILQNVKGNLLSQLSRGTLFQARLIDSVID